MSILRKNAINTSKVLTEALPFIQKLASNGFKDALKNDKNFMNGKNIFKGAVTYKAIADDLNYDYANPETLVH